MNILKQNTDYGFRLAANLAINSSRAPISAKVLSEQESISADFTAKILQKLTKAGIVYSVMGSSGGFALAKTPDKITLYDIILALQGAILVNKCSPGLCSCPRQPKCPISGILCQIENDIIEKFKSVSLEDVITNKNCLKAITA